MNRHELESSLEHAAAQLLVAAQGVQGDNAEDMKALAAQLQLASVAFKGRSAQ